ncbi:hypothetical protein PI124_g4953 [Phytophthora idaei]|nr:hypothetical protein PI124_g4953 [Phytophthora idaei]
MEHREELELDALAMNVELSDLFNDFGCTEDTLLSDEVLDLPDLELLLPSEDLGDELLDSLLPDAANEEDSVSAIECEEDGEGLTVSVDGSSSLAVEEQERELIAREVKFLEAQRDFLQFRAEATANGLQFEDWENEGKREASPLMHYRMTLMTPMESFIRLGKDPAERHRKLLEMRDEKLDTVRRFVAAQTRGIDPTREFFYVDTFERFGKFYTVDFSVSLVNSVTVDEVAEVTQDQFVVPRDGVSRLLGCVTNRTYYDGMVDTFLHARTVERVDLLERSCVGRSFLVQESNAVFYLKRFDASELDGSDGGQLGEQGDLTVMMSDFVDVDELHPYHGSRVRKDISVGITLRRHVGHDGAESVVMRRSPSSSTISGDGPQDPKW